MKKLAAIAFLFILIGPAFSQEGYYNGKAYIYGRGVQQLSIPTIPGFVPLYGDFHLHSIYSDGSVLPQVRANEIFREGLNAFAITDHAESSPIIPELPKDSNKANEIAKERAAKLGLVFAPGTEITRDFGGDDLSAHFVCLFVGDVNKLEGLDTVDMLREAKRQGAFIFWAHPWEAGPGVWGNEIAKIMEEKLIDGVEVMNAGYSSQETAAWGLKNNLTLMANTDSHDPIFYGRPLTIAFAKEKSAEALKEAMLAHRTVALNGSTFYGREEYLSKLFYSCVSIKTPKVDIPKNGTGKLIFTNASSIGYRIIVDKAKLGIDMRKEIIIEANTDTYINVSNKSLPPGNHEVWIEFDNANMYAEGGKQPRMKLKIAVNVK